MLMLGAILVGLLAACAPQTVTVEVTRVVTEKEEVEVPVEVTVEVPAEPEVVDYGEVVIFSTQAVPVEEAEKMRGIVLADFQGHGEFVPLDQASLIDRVLAEAGTDDGSVDILIALH